MIISGVFILFTLAIRSGFGQRQEFEGSKRFITYIGDLGKVNFAR